MYGAELIRKHTHSVLDLLVPEGSICALIGWPDHNNVGDSMIWLGQLSYLRNRNARIVYASRWRDASVEVMRKFLPDDGIILFSGGGNLGDLWPTQQPAREKIVSSFPGNKIIQLPQSIHFRDPYRLENASKIFSAHKNLVILARDRASFVLSSRCLKAATLLCPDMAFLFDYGPSLPPGEKLFFLRRRDRESALPWAEAKIPPQIIDCDWALGPMSQLAACVNELTASGLTSQIGDLMERAALYQIQRARGLFASAKAVATDRLHCHILCLNIGVRHAILDNCYGKVTSFHQEWTRGEKLTTLFDKQEDAIDWLLEQQA